MVDVDPRTAAVDPQPSAAVRTLAVDRAPVVGVRTSAAAVAAHTLIVARTLDVVEYTPAAWRTSADDHRLAAAGRMLAVVVGTSKAVGALSAGHSLLAGRRPVLAARRMAVGGVGVAVGRIAVD